MARAFDASLRPVEAVIASIRRGGAARGDQR